MEYRFKTASEALYHLTWDILRDGDELVSRGGSRVKEITYPHIVLTEPFRREILTRGRHASLPAQIAETMWVLSGRNDVEWLSNYLPRAEQFSDDGKVWRGAYGPRLRAWPRRNGSGDDVIDQLAFVVDLLKSAATTRRAVINIYDPVVDSDAGLDIPCNDWIHFLNRNGRLDMHIATRSNDLMWGWSGINAFEWSALQEIVAGLVGVGVGELHFSISSLHLYDRHWEKAYRMTKETLPSVTPRPSPRFDASVVKDGGLDKLDVLLRRWFSIEQQIRDPRLNVVDRDVAQLINNFPEPMMRSWLMVIANHWRPNDEWLLPVAATALYHAALASPQRAPLRPVKEPKTTVRHDPFTDAVVALHTEKDKVYGDSWKKRGEQISILANIARKVDRLDAAGAGDSESDTTTDLLVYLAKYRVWLSRACSPRTTEAEEVNDLLKSLPVYAPPTNLDSLYITIREDFDEYQDGVANDVFILDTKIERVDRLLAKAARLARTVWAIEQGRAANHEEWKAGNATRHWNPDA